MGAGRQTHPRCVVPVSSAGGLGDLHHRVALQQLSNNASPIEGRSDHLFSGLKPKRLKNKRRRHRDLIDLLCQIKPSQGSHRRGIARTGRGGLHGTGDISLHHLLDLGHGNQGIVWIGVAGLGGCEQRTIGLRQLGGCAGDDCRQRRRADRCSLRRLRQNRFNHRSRAQAQGRRRVLDRVDQAADHRLREVGTGIALGTTNEATAHIHQVGDHHIDGLELAGDGRLCSVARTRLRHRVEVQQRCGRVNAESGLELLLRQTRGSASLEQGRQRRDDRGAGRRLEHVGHRQPCGGVFRAHLRVRLSDQRTTSGTGSLQFEVTVRVGMGVGLLTGFCNAVPVIVQDAVTIAVLKDQRVFDVAVDQAARHRFGRRGGSNRRATAGGLAAAAATSGQAHTSGCAKDACHTAERGPCSTTACRCASGRRTGPARWQ